MLNVEERMRIANTILSQLGGDRFMVMVGARNLTALGDPPGLSFNIGGGSKDRINLVVVKLMPSDTYRMEFYRTRKKRAHEIHNFDDIYADNLQDVFSRATGFATHL